MSRGLFLLAALCVSAIKADAQTFVRAFLSGPRDTTRVLRAVIHADSATGEAIGEASIGASGGFATPLSRLPSNVVIDILDGGQVLVSVKHDSGAVRASLARPLVIRMSEAPQPLKPVTVNVEAQRRPGVSSFFEPVGTTRSDNLSALSPWLDPLGGTDLAGLLSASPEVASDGSGAVSFMGASSSSNLVQVGGIRAPSGLQLGTLPLSVALSQWDVTQGSAAGVSANALLLMGGSVPVSYASSRIGRSFAGGSPLEGAVDPSSPWQLAIGSRGPIGRLRYSLYGSITEDRSQPLARLTDLSTVGRFLLDSLQSAGGAGLAVAETHARRVQGGLRADFLPDSPARTLTATVLASRTAATTGGADGRLLASSGRTFESDATFGALEYTTTFASRVLQRSEVDASWSRSTNAAARSGVAIVAPDTLGNLVRGGGGTNGATRAQSWIHTQTAFSWYSPDNRSRFDVMAELARQSLVTTGPDASGEYSTGSWDQLRNTAFGTYFFSPAGADKGSTMSTAATAVSWRTELSDATTATVGGRVDAWRSGGLGSVDGGIQVDPTVRVSLMHRLRSLPSLIGKVGVMRIGVGRFVDWADLAEWAAGSGGGDPPSSVCTGAAVPPIRAFGAVPACVGASPGAPVATRLGNDIAPPRSDRADFSIILPEFSSGFSLELGASVTRNRRLPFSYPPFLGLGTVGVLAAEGGRPLRVPASSISSAGIVPTPSAGVAGGTAVSLLTADGASNASQLRVRIGTRDPFGTTQLEIRYAFTTGDELSLAGMLAGTSTAPASIPLSTGGSHSVAVSLGRWFGLSLLRASMVIRSGSRYTPIVDRDVNGDGLANDAAYIRGDSARSWASRLSPQASRCILEQAGRIAAGGACTGPWTVTSQLALSVPGVVLGLPRGTSLDIQVQNPLGWLQSEVDNAALLFGPPAPVQRVVLHVVGYDSTSGAFGGALVSGFGRPLPGGQSHYSPRVTLSARIPLGRRSRETATSRTLDALSRDSSRARRLQTLERYLMDAPPVALIVIRSAESVGVTAEQRRALLGIQSEAAMAVQSEMDAILAASITSQLLISARGRVTALLEDGAQRVRTILSEEQIRALPDVARVLMNVRLRRYAEALEP